MLHSVNLSNKRNYKWKQLLPHHYRPNATKKCIPGARLYNFYLYISTIQESTLKHYFQYTRQEIQWSSTERSWPQMFWDMFYSCQNGNVLEARVKARFHFQSWNSYENIRREFLCLPLLELQSALHSLYFYKHYKRFVSTNTQAKQKKDSLILIL